MFWFLIHGIWIMIFSISLHELGHLLALKKAGVNAQIKWWKTSWRKFGYKVGKPEDYMQLSKLQKYDVYFWGILGGLIPILMAVWLFNTWWNLLIPMYLWGCKHDFKVLRRLWSCK